MKKVDTIKPSPTTGLRHVALFVRDLEACVEFYTHLMGMAIEWQPDDDNIYLSSGNDNLALHRADPQNPPDGKQRLDHIGFIINEPEQVDTWYDFLRDNGVTLLGVPKNHRDGARSFYCEDPEGTVVQIIYHPPLATPSKSK